MFKIISHVPGDYYYFTIKVPSSTQCSIIAYISECSHYTEVCLPDIKLFMNYTLTIPAHNEIVPPKQQPPPPHTHTQ